MPDEVRAQVELEKLQLEVKELRGRAREFWVTRLTLLIPILVVALTVAGTLRSQAKQQAFERQQAAIAFLEERLNRLYVPTTMHLAVVKGFFDRYSSASAAERTLLESAWREHNTAIRELVTAHSAYIAPAEGQTAECVDAMVTQLLTHLAQWDVVYRLKHEAKAWNGPVFAGIAEFGYRGFPSDPECGADAVFERGLREIRLQLHEARQPERAR